MPIFEISGIELTYEEHGQGTEAVVFAHDGGAFDPDWWHGHHDFTGTYRCVAVAGAVSTIGDIDTVQLAEALTILLNQLGIDTAHVVCHLGGCRISLALAIFHPERVSSLAIIDAAVGVGEPGMLSVLRRHRTHHETIAPSKVQASSRAKGSGCPVMLCLASADPTVAAVCERHIRALLPNAPSIDMVVTHASQSDHRKAREHVVRHVGKHSTKPTPPRALPRPRTRY